MAMNVKALKVATRAARRYNRFATTIGAAGLALQAACLLAACDAHQDARTGTNAQNEQFTMDKQTELSQVTGPVDRSGNASATYNGTCFLYRNNVHYNCSLIVSQTTQIQQATSSTSPVETVLVPTLAATLNFDVMKGVKPPSTKTGDEYAGYLDTLNKYPDILDITSNSAFVSVSKGDYDSQSKILDLPYMVSGQTGTGNWGEIRGSMDASGKHFKGTLTTTNLGKVGEIDVTRN